jgi:hypothetical protein
MSAPSSRRGKHRPPIHDGVQPDRPGREHPVLLTYGSRIYNNLLVFFLLDRSNATNLSAVFPAMIRNRAALEAEFLKICHGRGEAWIESVMRPLRLPGDAAVPADIPLAALTSIVRIFGDVAHPARGVAAI